MADNSKAAQHVRRREPGRRDGARSRRTGRVFASDDRSAVKQRDTARREKRRAADSKRSREQRFAERLAEVPQSTLDAYAHYELEVAKRRELGRPTLKTRDELRAIIDDAARIA